MTIIRRRALWAWLVMAVAMSANGVFRELILTPRFGERRSSVASAVIGIALIQLIAWQALRTAPSRSRGELAGIAAVWLFLTLGFEFTFGHWVDHKSWTELLANYNLARGRLWPVVLATIVAAPFVWGRPQKTGR
jgi:hypothetical protein